MLRMTGVHIMILLTNFYSIFVYYLALLVLGLVALPLTRKLFSRQSILAIVTAKPIGILLTAYFSWLLPSLNILPFTRLTIFISLAFVLIISLLVKFRLGIPTRGDRKNFILKFIAFEFFFFSLLFLMAQIRAFAPRIEGLEKFMDFGFQNAILKSQFFPPRDPWLSGFSINYYYFGHYLASFLTHLSNLTSAITYNLQLANIFALSFTLSFGLVYSAIRSLKSKNQSLAIISGLIAALILNFAANLQLIYHAITQGLANYWYPDATRFIEYTIHEFPVYSYIVADLHGHLSALPFALLNLILIFQLGRNFSSEVTHKGILGRWNVFLVLLLGLSLAADSMSNAWDLPISLLCLGVVLFFKLIQSKFSKLYLLNSIFIILGVIISWLLFTLPFLLNFDNFSAGIGLVLTRSPLWQLFILWGFFIFVSLIYYFILFKQNKKLQPSRIFFLGISLVAILLLILPEIIYVKDIYIQSHHRANTMFKLTYQAFVIFSLLTGFVFYHLFSTRKYFIFKPIFLLGLICVLSYPFFSFKSYYGDFKRYQSLDGTLWLKKEYPGNYQALQFLNTLPADSIIIEAVGESYTKFNHLSSYSGLSTFLGWRVHEWLWRGSFDLPGQRTEIARRIYETSDSQIVLRLLRSNQIDYLIIGPLERQAYPGLNLQSIKSISTPVFSSPQTVIYKIMD